MSRLASVGTGSRPRGWPGGGRKDGERGSSVELPDGNEVDLILQDAGEDERNRPETDAERRNGGGGGSTGGVLPAAYGQRRR
jgi:hypothetical protein